MPINKPGVFSAHIAYNESDEGKAHCVVMANGEQLHQMFFAIADLHSSIIPPILGGIFAAMDKEQPGFAELMNQTISNFKPKSNEPTN